MNFLKIVTFTAIFVLFSSFDSPVFAHIIISPSQVGIARIQDFTVTVPNEKDNPIVAVRLLIPHGVTSVIPYVVNNWTITSQIDSTNNVTEIDWTDGSIPVRQAQELQFSAQMPSKVTTLPWKAYDTYSDGTVVNWDVDPKALAKLSDAQQDALADKENKGTYSTTQVINDLKVPQTATVSEIQQVDQKATMSLIFAIIAIGIACISLSIAKRKETGSISKTNALTHRPRSSRSSRKYSRSS